MAVVCYLATQSHARIKAPQGAEFSLSFLIVFSSLKTTRKRGENERKQRENEEKTRGKRGENRRKTRENPRKREEKKTTAPPFRSPFAVLPPTHSFFPNSALEFKGGPGKCSLGGKIPRAQYPNQNPTPNRPKPSQATRGLSSTPCPQARRSAL